MTLTVIYALLGLLLIAFNVYQRKLWLKYAMMVLGFVLVFSASQHAGLDNKSTLEVAIYVGVMIVFAFIIQLIAKAVCAKLAARYPEWIRADIR